MHTTAPLSSFLAFGTLLGGAVAALAPATAAAPSQDSYGPPPGMVAIPTKVIEIGGDPDEIEELIVKDERVRENLMSEVGDGRQAVQGFYLMPYEVTNEQYLRFVLATGHQPPQHWGEPAIEAAARAYLEETREDPDAAKFSAEDWWALNWRDAEWSMPTQIATLPVVYVDKGDVDDYCEWAGLRLMTEFEYQAAGRDTDPQRYTWGDDWKRANAITSDPDVRAKPAEVGSIEDNASLHGIYDLCGNVWEWTSSKYVALPGYEDIDYTIKRGSKRVRKTAVALFDPSLYVVVGGSFANTAMAARLSTRRPTSPSYMASALGFRCAADTAVVSGRARATARNLPFEQRSRIDLDPSGALGFERWITTEGRLRKDGYAIIDGHEWLAWVPAVQLPETSLTGLKSAGKDDPVPFGVLTTSVALSEPALEPGTYLVAWRPEGEPKKRKPRDDEKEKEKEDGEDYPDGSSLRALARVDDDEIEDPFGGFVDYEEDAWVFYDADLRVVASLTAPEIDAGSVPDENPFGTLAVLAASDIPSKGEHARSDCSIPPTLDAIRLDGFVKNSTNRRGFEFRIDLGVEVGTIDRTWRR